MPGPFGARPTRAKGSQFPRLAGVGVVVVLAVGGLAGYLASARKPAPPRRHPVVLSSRVLKVQTVGIIAFGPDNDGDAFAADRDDHPLMLQPTRAGLRFLVIPAAELRAGVPVWTVDQMADGSAIFIYTATGQCLSAAGRPAPAPGPGKLRLAHCDLGQGQRWRPVHPGTALGQAYAGYASARTGRCVTAAARGPGPATLAACGSPKLKTQQIAFWWNA